MRYINCENLVKKYGRNSAQVSAVSQMNLTIDLGEFVGIMGDSGAGKSTLLSIMGAMNAPTSGRYVVDDIDVYSLNSEQQADFRREFLGFVFQSFHLIPYLTVLENTMLPLTTIKAGRQLKREMAEEALNSVGLSGKENRLPSQISGGEQERVAIARAIVNRPPILLADEPTGNLDSHTSGEMMEFLQRLNEDGMTIVMVTHNSECAKSAGRLIRVVDGRLETDSPN